MLIRLFEPRLAPNALCQGPMNAPKDSRAPCAVSNPTNATAMMTQA